MAKSGTDCTDTLDNIVNNRLVYSKYIYSL